MALRYHHQSRRQQSLFSGAIGRIVAVLIAVLALLTLLALVLVNGATIRGPLASLLSDRLNATVTIEDAAFSPLYPDTLKLNGVKIRAQDFEGVIDEAYVEIDLTRSLFSDTLYVDDLYLNAGGADLGPLLNKAVGALPFTSASLKALRLDNLPLNGERLQAHQSRLRFQDVTLDGGGALGFKEGTLQLEEGSILQELPFKSLELTLSEEGSSLNLKRFTGQLLGGTVSGAGVFNTETQSLALSTLNLSQNVLKLTALKALPFTLSAEKGFLSSVLLDVQPQGTLLSGLTGSLDALKSDPAGLSLNFRGEVAEISHPQSATVLTDNEGSLSVSPAELQATLQGHYLEGDYTLKARYAAESSTLTLEELTLAGGKVEFGAAQLAPLRRFLKEGRINLEHVRLDKISLLSFMDNLPLSAESLTLSLDGFSLSKDGLRHHPTGVFNMEAGSLLISDLYVARLTALGTLDDNLLTLSLPQLTFREGSALTLSGTLSRLPDGQSFIYALTRNFDVSALNSRLSPHLFAGKVNAELSLTSTGNTPDALLKHLKGKVTLTSDSLLISSFGLDLINGGGRERHELNLTELRDALSVADGGFYDTFLQLTFDNGEGQLRGNTVLPTAEVYLNHRLNLEDLTLSGRSLFTSPSHDSVTYLTLSGPLTGPHFSLRPQKRGEPRPGIGANFNAPKIEANAQANAESKLSTAPEEDTGSVPLPRQIPERSAEAAPSQEVRAVADSAVKQMNGPSPDLKDVAEETSRQGTANGPLKAENTGTRIKEAQADPEEIQATEHTDVTATPVATEETTETEETQETAETEETVSRSVNSPSSQDAVESRQGEDQSQGTELKNTTPSSPESPAPVTSSTAAASAATASELGPSHGVSSAVKAPAPSRESALEKDSETGTLTEGQEDLEATRAAAQTPAHGAHEVVLPENWPQSGP